MTKIPNPKQKNCNFTNIAENREEINIQISSGSMKHGLTVLVISASALEFVSNFEIPISCLKIIAQQ